MRTSTRPSAPLLTKPSTRPSTRLSARTNTRPSAKPSTTPFTRPSTISSAPPSTRISAQQLMKHRSTNGVFMRAFSGNNVPYPKVNFLLDI